jgi:hypothetical protein
MKLLCNSKTASVIGLAAACALVIGAPDRAAAQVVCNAPTADNPMPRMLIRIINNDANYNIYPVYTTGGGGSSDRARAWCEVPRSELPNSLYPQQNYRFYINPTGKGIPPKGKLVVSVPMLSPLVPFKQIDPKANGQVIDWWAGGRIELFDGPTCTAQPNNPKCDQPPDALTALFKDKPGQTKITIANTVPLCRSLDGGITTCQALTFFKDTTVFGNEQPSQTLEFTLGAVNPNPDATPTNSKPAILLDPLNLDIDVSYVDTAYMPAALEPFNPGIPNIGQSGYIGSPMKIDDFRKALKKFLGDYDGWPQYVVKIGGQNQTILKLPSMIQMTGAGGTGLTPKPWKPADEAIKTTKACFTNQPCSADKRLRTGDVSAFCQSVQAVEQLFRCNYKNYAAIYKTKCDPNNNPVDLTEDLLVAHIYGFSPFVEGRPNAKACPANANLLENTPGYSANKSEKFHQVKEQNFDVLQRWKTGDFDPWWLLIHANKKSGYPTEYANIANAYAYSVDDAVGNLQANGNGFFIAVGGTAGLPNPNPASPPIIVGLGFAKTDAVRFTKYGVCLPKGQQPNKVIDPNFPAFDLNALWSNLSKCPITLVDNKNQFYTFKVKPGPYPYTPDTDKSRAMIDCSDNTPGTRGADWCSRVFAYAIKVTHGDENHAITPPACKNQTGTNCQ